MDPTAECDLWLQSDVTQLQCHGGCSAAVQVRCTWSAVSRPCSTLAPALQHSTRLSAARCTLHTAHTLRPPPRAAPRSPGRCEGECAAPGRATSVSAEWGGWRAAAGQNCTLISRLCAGSVRAAAGSAVTKQVSVLVAGDGSLLLFYCTFCKLRQS